MKKNQLKYNRSYILFFLAALIFPLYINAQVDLDASNNVGIGTASPDIFGNGSAFRTLSVLGPNTSANSCGILELASKSTDADANIAGVLNFIASSNASTKQSIAQVVSFTQGATSNNRGGILIFNTKPDNATSTLERMRIDNTGKVGIGTSTVASKLDVEGGVSIGSTYSGTTAAPTNGAIIEGSVGIGLTNPSKKLNLESASTNDGILVKQTSTTAASLYLNASTGHQWALFSKGTGNGATAAGDFSIYNLTSGGDRFYIEGSTGYVGIGTTNPAVKLEVTGDFNVNGIATCSANSWSDSIVKTNIDSLHNVLSTIGQLIPKSFYFDTANIYGLNFSNKKQYGFIAQDVETVLPELLLSTTKNADIDSLGNIIHPAITLKTLNYNAFIGILTKGIQELQQKNDSLETKTVAQDSTNVSLQNSLNQLITKSNNQDSLNTILQNQLTQLSSLINSCCNDHHDNGNHNGNREVINNQTNIELNDAQSVVLNQNVPNPFSEQTSINYSLPENTIKAQMLFYNSQGKLIQSTELTQKGKGTLNVFASDLSSGIYTYTLVVDGEIIESKKMVKQ